MDNYEKQAEAQRAEQEKKQQAEQMKNAMMTQLLTPEAKDRLNKIKLVKPDKVAMIENALIQGAQRGQITSKISEADLIKMLERESERKVDTKITFTRRGLDDDW